MKYIVNNPNYPSPFDLDMGSKEWIKKYGRACWDDFSTIGNNSFYNGRYRYNNIKKYMLGEQSMEPYLKLLDAEVANNDKSWLRATKQPLKIADKFARMTKSTLKKSAYGLVITAIDSLSTEEKTDYYVQNASKIKLREEAKKIGLEEDTFDAPDRGMSTIEELDVHMEYGYKSRFEIEAEEIIKVIMNNCKHDAIRQKNIEQLHDYGFVGYKDYLDKNGDIKERIVDVRDFIVSRCKFNDFSDATYMGEVLDLTLGDVRALDLKKEISTDQLQELYAKLSSNGSSAYLTNESVDPKHYENYRIQLLDLEFKASDVYIQETIKDKLGNDIVKRTRDLGSVKNGSDVEKIDHEVIYTFKWIIGSDIYFGCEKQTNMKRANTNLSDVKYSYSCAAPQMINMETQSMAELYIPIIDSLQIVWLKYQNVISRAKTRGIIIDVNATDNLPIGKGGKRLGPLEAFKFYEKTGSLIYRSVKEDGKISQSKPITELQNGLGDEAQRYFAEINNQIYLLQSVSGYNEITDGSTPDSRTTNTLAEKASSSTNNSIDFMKEAERNCFEELANGILIRVQDAAENGTLKNYVNAIGKESVKFFEISPEISARELGLKVEDKPSDEEKMELQKYLEIALQSGQITIADISLIKKVDNIKHAESLLVLKVKQNQEKQQEIAIQNSESQGKIQRDAITAANQAAMEKLNFETESKLKIMQFEGEKEAMLLDLKYKYELKLKEMEVTGRVKQSENIANAKTYSSDIETRTKENIHNATVLKEMATEDKEKD